jgi:hypothetical protein
MPAYPPAEESLDRLHRAGWSVGAVGTYGGGGLVTGTNGVNALKAWGSNPAEAWYRACEQAAAVGMLAPPRGVGAGGADE